MCPLGRRVEVLADLFIRRGPPENLRSDNGPEFTAKLVRGWLTRLRVQMLYIEQGSPCENGYNESFNGKLRDAFLNAEIVYTLREAVVLVEQWRGLCTKRRAIRCRTDTDESEYVSRSAAPEMRNA